MKVKYKISKKFLIKSIEAYKMAIEIFNKPTINYRSEGFSFFIVNAWDLMLKAKVIEDKGHDYIYRNNKKKETKSLSELLDYVIPSRTDYTRKNIETIINLRNQATHYILEEFDIIYAPIFQACVVNYYNKFYDYFGYYPMSDKDSYIVLVSDIKQIDEATILKKLNKASANILINTLKEIKENENNEKFSLDLSVDIKMKLERNRSKADVSFVYEKDANSTANTIEKYVDMNQRYPYRYKKIEELVKEKFPGIPNFNANSFASYCKENKIYDNSDYFYENTEGSSKFKKYSKSFVDMLMIEISGNIDLFINYKTKK